MRIPNFLSCGHIVLLHFESGAAVGVDVPVILIMSETKLQGGTSAQNVAYVDFGLVEHLQIW